MFDISAGVGNKPIPRLRLRFDDADAPFVEDNAFS